MAAGHWEVGTVSVVLPEWPEELPLPRELTMERLTESSRGVFVKMTKRKRIGAKG